MKLFSRNHWGFLIAVSFATVATAKYLPRSFEGHHKSKNPNCPSEEAAYDCESTCEKSFFQCSLNCGDIAECLSECNRAFSYCLDYCPCHANCFDGCDCPYETEFCTAETSDNFPVLGEEALGMLKTVGKQYNGQCIDVTSHMPHGLVFARSQNVPNGDVLECYNWCNGINETMPYTLNFAYYGVWQEFNECWCGNAQPEVELDLAECAEKSSKASSIFSMQNRQQGCSYGMIEDPETGIKVRQIISEYYDNDQQCWASFKCQHGFNAEYKIRSFHTEKTNDVVGLSAMNTGQRWYYDGYFISTPWISTSDTHLVFEFKSDDSFNRSGFDFLFRCKEK